MILFLLSTFEYLCNPARYHRKRPAKKYPERFIQDVDYIEFIDDTYKYMMIRDRAVQLSVQGLHIIHTYFELFPTGLLIIKAGYKWDGPSGPTIDTPSFMRSSAAHDVCFQIMREKLIKDERRAMFFKEANEDLKTISQEDGMLGIRSDWVKWSVDNFGEKHTVKAA